MSKISSTIFTGLVFFIHFCSADSFQCFATPLKEEKLDHQTILFSGDTNLSLAEKMANYLGTSLGSASIKKFQDGEIKIQLDENVHGKNVLILQSNHSSSKQNSNNTLMELYLLVKAMKQASAASITAIIPYYGYTKQDRKILPKAPVSTADIALFLEVAGVDRVVTVDLHGGQIQGFFRSIPVDNLYAASLFIPYFAAKDLHNIVIVSPDVSEIEKAKKFAEGFEKYGIPVDLAFVRNYQNISGSIQSMGIIGNVEDSDVILVSDIFDPSDTLIKAAQLLKKQGANRVFAVITHPVFSDNTLAKIRDSDIEELVIADTAMPHEMIPHNISSIPVSPLLGTAIRKTQIADSLADLFP